jgi:hypothetical protein
MSGRHASAAPNATAMALAAAPGGADHPPVRAALPLHAARWTLERFTDDRMDGLELGSLDEDFDDVIPAPVLARSHVSARDLR